MAVDQKYAPEMGCPVKWKQGPKPALPWCLKFDTSPCQNYVTYNGEQTPEWPLVRVLELTSSNFGTEGSQLEGDHLVGIAR